MESPCVHVCQPNENSNNHFCMLGLKILFAAPKIIAQKTSLVRSLHPFLSPLIGHPPIAHSISRFSNYCASHVHTYICARKKRREKLMCDKREGNYCAAAASSLHLKIKRTIECPKFPLGAFEVLPNHASRLISSPFQLGPTVEKTRHM